MLVAQPLPPLLKKILEETLLHNVILFILQGQVEGCRYENERLRARETAALNTMKHNAQVASEYLNKAALNAETSIK